MKTKQDTAKELFYKELATKGYVSLFLDFPRSNQWGNHGARLSYWDENYKHHRLVVAHGAGYNKTANCLEQLLTPVLEVENRREVENACEKRMLIVKVKDGLSQHEILADLASRFTK